MALRVKKVVSKKAAFAAAGVIVATFGVSVAVNAGAPSGHPGAAPRPKGECDTQECKDAARAAWRAAFPPAQPIDPAKPGMSDADAISDARKHASGLNGSVNAQSAAAIPAKSARMTMGQLERQQGLSADPDIASDRPVIVVTVHAPIVGRGAPGTPAQVLPVYTEVYDASTGFLILEAGGVEMVK